MTLDDWRVDIDDRLEDGDPWAVMMARVFALPIGEGGQLAMLRMLRTMSTKSGRSLAVLADSADALARGESVIQPATPVGIMADELSAAIRILSEPFVQPGLRVAALEDAVEVSIDGVTVAPAGAGQVVVGEPLPEGVLGVTVGAGGLMRPAPLGWAPPGFVRPFDARDHAPMAYIGGQTTDHAEGFADERLTSILGHRAWLAAGIEADPPMLAEAAMAEREELLRECPGVNILQLDQYASGRVWRVGVRHMSDGVTVALPVGWSSCFVSIDVAEGWAGAELWKGGRPAGSRRVYA